MAKLKDGFYKQTASSIGSDLHVLLAGGGSKALSDFAYKSDLTGFVTGGPYLPLTGGTVTGELHVNTFHIKKNNFSLDNSGTFWIGVSENGELFRTDKDWYNSYTILDALNYSTYALPLSGGTLTGDLTLKASSANGFTPKIHFLRGTFDDTYQDWSVGNESGGLHFYCDYGEGVNDVLTLGKTSAAITGTLTATKFITTGGTSSQFVKGDGSLDSNTYLTSLPSHNHSLLKGWADTRSKATTPNDYNASFKVVGIKTAGTTLGLTSTQTGNYATLIGWRGWSDSSGGYSWEIASTDKNRLYVRSGATTAWDNGWQAIAYLNDIPTSLKNPNKLTLSAGAFAAKTYDGSAAVTVKVPTHTSHLTNNSGFITIDHTHSYLPLSGGDLTGPVKSSSYIDATYFRPSFAAAGIQSSIDNSFRTTFTGTSTPLPFISTSRTGASAQGKLLGNYAPLIAFGAGDTHGFLQVPYSSAGTIRVGGGNGDSIKWTADLIHSGNIGSQSVANATNATAMSSFTAASAGNATKRYVWMSWNDNSGKPAYSDKLTFQTSTNTLFVNDKAVSLSGHTHNYAGSSSAGGPATSAVSVVDYGNTSKLIQIGYAGTGLTSSTCSHLAGYTASGTKIKDITAEEVKKWLSLGSAAYTSSGDYATASHTHKGVQLSNFSSWDSATNFGMRQWATATSNRPADYGTVFDFKDPDTTWYHRLAFTTGGKIILYQGINTTTMTKIGTVSYDGHTHSGYATTASLANYLPLAGGTLTGNLTFKKATPYIYFNISGSNTAVFAYDGSTLRIGSSSYTTTIKGSSTTIDNTLTCRAIKASAHNTYNIGVSGTRFKNGYFQGSVYAASGFFQSSDEQLKEFFNPISIDLEKLKKLRKNYFKFKGDDTVHIGVSAQEIKELYPEIVSEIDNVYNVDYSKLAVIALKGIDALYDMILELKEENRELRRLANL